MVASLDAGAQRRMLRLRRLALLGGFLYGAATFGCQPAAERAAVLGQVAWSDGRPLEQGMIEFTSFDDSQPASAGAPIIGGGYHIPREKGLPRGRYCVRIYASAPLSASAAGAPGALGVAPPNERVAPECNVESKLTAEIQSAVDQRFNFKVVPNTFQD